jgi:hypothetical protein
MGTTTIKLRPKDKRKICEVVKEALAEFTKEVEKGADDRGANHVHAKIDLNIHYVIT